MSAKVNALPPVKLTQLAAADSKMVKHDGIACLYNIEIDRLWTIIELAPGLFGTSISEPSKIVILNQHDSWSPIGKADKFTDGKDDLHMDFLLNTEVQAGAECSSNIKAGVLSGLSVGFDINRVEIQKRGEGARSYEVEVITDATLKEVSCVTFPALDDARVENSDIDPDAAITFTIEGHHAMSQERLMAGDHIRLATYPARPKRIRPSKVMSEDEQHPGARDALTNLLASF